MLSGLERKTRWSLAEHAGEVSPDGMQRLFTTARWDAGGVRDDVRGYAAAALGDPDGVLIGDDTGFEKGGSRTKPQLMIERAVTAGIPFRWVTADEAYGDNGPLRAYLRVSCGDGAKGERRYDWALVASSRPEISLMIRRSVSRPSELAFYLCHTPQPAPLSRLVTVAGARWAVKECFQAAKNETGLDHYQVRRYESWYRHVTLAMLALAFLAVTRAALADSDAGLANSANEIRRTFTALCAPSHGEQHARQWSRWRHHHQERALRCHYQRQRLQDH